jgi:hypothetical protein
VCLFALFCSSACKTNQQLAIANKTNKQTGKQQTNMQKRTNKDTQNKKKHKQTSKRTNKRCLATPSINQTSKQSTHWTPNAWVLSKQ